MQNNLSTFFGNKSYCIRFVLSVLSEASERIQRR